MKIFSYFSNEHITFLYYINKDKVLCKVIDCTYVCVEINKYKINIKKMMI